MLPRARYGLSRTSAFDGPTLAPRVQRTLVRRRWRWPLPRWPHAAVPRRRLPELRKSLDAGADASVSARLLNTASLAGFGAVVAALPAFAVIRDGFLAVPGGPLVSIAVAAT